MSVKRNVTVPLGNSSITTTSDRTRPLAQRSKLLQPTELVEAPHRVGVHSSALGRRGSIPANVDEPLALAEEDAVPVGHVSDLYALLRAIDEAMPDDAVICIEGTSVPADVASFLEPRQAPHPSAIAPHTYRPEPQFFHLPLTGTNLSELRSLAERHAEPEIADHLVVYRGRDVLLSAPRSGVIAQHWRRRDGDGRRLDCENLLREGSEA